MADKSPSGSPASFPVCSVPSSSQRYYARILFIVGVGWAPRLGWPLCCALYRCLCRLVGLIPPLLVRAVILSRTTFRSQLPSADHPRGPGRGVAQQEPRPLGRLQGRRTGLRERRRPFLTLLMLFGTKALCLFLKHHMSRSERIAVPIPPGVQTLLGPVMGSVDKRRVLPWAAVRIVVQRIQQSLIRQPASRKGSAASIAQRGIFNTTFSGNPPPTEISR